MADELVARIDGVAALAEPVRRSLYRFVAAQDEPVSRDQAAAAVGVPLHQAKFHLDRLVDEGLLEAEFSRPPGRSGPGAGRPTKRYRWSGRDIAVSIPERRYDLAGALMATAIDESVRDGVPVAQALTSVAGRHGALIGADMKARLGPRPHRRERVDGGMRGARGVRLRAAAGAQMRRADQLPFPRAGGRAHRAGLRHEPHAPGGRGGRAGRPGAGGHAGPARAPLLRGHRAVLTAPTAQDGRPRHARRQSGARMRQASVTSWRRRRRSTASSRSITSGQPS